MHATIPFQEPLSAAEQNAIIQELRHLPELCDYLATLDIALGFLVSVGGDPRTKLEDFVSEKLKMTVDEGFKGRVGQCQLANVRSLWLTLSRHRAMLLHRQGQPALDMVSDCFMVQLTDEQVRE